jgi:AP2-like factor, euAP2 lineage
MNLAKEIILTKHQVAIVDEEDYDFLSKYQWHYSNGYAINRSAFFHEDGRRRTVLMHRLILGFDFSTPLIDHADGNGLNNCKSNLRIASHADNSRNARRPSHNTSGYKGVSKGKSGRWRASIHLNDRKINLGTFDNKQDAAKAYNIKAIELFGEFANLNDVDHEGFHIPNKHKQTSNYKGVNKRKNSWISGIYQNGKRIHIGSFKTEIEAAKAYNEKAIQLFGEYVKLNVINEEAI